MEGVDTAQDHAGGTGAGERGGNFLADVAGFADADDDNFSALLQRTHHQFHRVVEAMVEPSSNGAQASELDIKHLPGFGEVAHGRKGCQGRGAISTANAQGHARMRLMAFEKF